MAEHRQLTLVVADISGYTRFITDKKVALAHAEQIIVDLLEAVVADADNPLVLHELEGDAVTFYAEWTDGEQYASDIANQAASMVAAFQHKNAEMADSCSICQCQACSNVTALKLKVIVHCGELVVNQFRQFTKIAGEPMIAVHRLLKNDIPSDEYIIYTEQFARQLPQAQLNNFEVRSQAADGLADMQLHVDYPSGLNTDPAATETAAQTKQRRLKQIGRLEQHRKQRPWARVGKLFGKKALAFNNLEIST